MVGLCPKPASRPVIQRQRFIITGTIYTKITFFYFITGTMLSTLASSFKYPKRFIIKVNQQQDYV